MSDISQWDPVDANNNAVPPDGFPEGMAASAVNDSSRALMGSVRRYAEDGGWFNWGHAATYVSASEFQVPGDLSAVYKLGRRVRIAQTATVYGTIAGTTVTANTVVAVAVDGGGVIANEAMQVSLGPETTAQIQIPAGFMGDFGGGAAPDGWVLCDGTAYDGNQALYSALWAAIGITWGGTGIADFQVPDSRGRGSIGSGQGNTAEGGGLGTNRTIGQSVGAETHTLTISELASHTHGLGNQQGFNTGGAQYVGNIGLSDPPPSGRNTASSGNDQSHNNMGPEIVVTKIIKL